MFNTYLAQTETYSHSLNFTTRQVLNLLIEQFLNSQRLYDVSNKLRVHVRVPNLFVQHLANCSLELWADLLGFVGHIESR